MRALVRNTRTKREYYGNSHKMYVTAHPWKVITLAKVKKDELYPSRKAIIVFEIMINGEPHFSSYARLPTVGRYTDWTRANSLGIRVQYLTVNNTWRSFYHQSYARSYQANYTKACKTIDVFERELRSVLKPLRTYDSRYNHLSGEVVVVENTKVPIANPVAEIPKDNLDSMLTAKGLLIRRRAAGGKWQDPDYLVKSNGKIQRDQCDLCWVVSSYPALSCLCANSISKPSIGGASKRKSNASPYQVPINARYAARWAVHALLPIWQGWDSYSTRKR